MNVAKVKPWRVGPIRNGYVSWSKQSFGRLNPNGILDLFDSKLASDCSCLDQPWLRKSRVYPQSIVCEG
jgi:hypothetical protein